jgi:oligogalacturonide lyase
VLKYLVILFLLPFFCSDLLAQDTLGTGAVSPMPSSWIDQDTGHLIVRLGSENSSIRNWYFHNDPFLPSKNGEGDLMVFQDVVDGISQISVINIKTRQTTVLTNSIDQKHLIQALLRKTREAIFQVDDTIFAVNVDTKKIRILFVFRGKTRGGVSTINADETLLAGLLVSPEQKKIYHKYKTKKGFFRRSYDEHARHEIFTINLRSGELKTVHTENNWLNHVQFSPTTPTLLMFCREGPWEKVDRVWKLEVDSGDVQLVHNRTMPNEIAGHEFFSIDGKSIWFDLQAPKGENFFLASVDVASLLPSKRYQLKDRDEWSYHYNISPDQKWFVGDGNNSRGSKKPRNAMWIYAYYPDGDRMRVEKLVNMRKHDYVLEPNVHVSKDGNWVIFGANFEGVPQTYAVQIAKR